MEENPYDKQIAALKSGEIAEITIYPQDFLRFRESWKQLPDRMQIVGEAGLNGRIIYRYMKKEK